MLILSFGLDVVRSLSARPARTLLTSSGIALSAAAVVLIVGLAGISRGEVANLFADSVSEYLTIELSSTSGVRSIPSTNLASAFASDLIKSHAASIRVTDVQVTARSWDRSADDEYDIVAIRGDIEAAVGLSLESGRSFDSGHDDRADRVALVGHVAASQLGLPPADGNNRIHIDGRQYVVIGVFN
ncbi:MAG: ABC transporter permease, partial [Acidimicrobiia bacterium]|nr:ABC transporter permease [Acidimicrobiia bacterium]